MKKISVFAIFFFLILNLSYSQEKSKRELRKDQKEKEKIEKQQQIEALIDAKAFVFIPDRALPSGARSIDLTGDNYFVKFESELIESVLPFFGRAYGGIGYGGDVGIKFKEDPKSFNINKGKKNYEMEAEVKSSNDTYNLTLTISFQGSASLFVTSTNRSTISYQGKMAPIEKEENKE